MRTGLAALLILALLTGAGLAEPPASSLRPQPRPTIGESARATAPVAPEPLPVQAAPTAEQPGLASVPRPMPRPDNRSAAVTPEEPAKASKKGSVCGDPAIKGAQLVPITSRVQGCGIEAPVQVTSVNGVGLSQPATLDCDTARALNEWVVEGLQPAFGNKKVVRLQVAAHYICRSRNNVRGARISEHGRGRAIDISGFTFADGSVISVANDYNRAVRKAHKAACGIFGTTLGPGSDGYHEDHLHFDTATYRSGTYCR